MSFNLVVNYRPRGDQVTAIEELTRGIRDGEQHQTLLGVTGSGKTFTMAKLIEAMDRAPIHQARFLTSMRPIALFLATIISGALSAQVNPALFQEASAHLSCTVRRGTGARGGGACRMEGSLANSETFLVRRCRFGGARSCR